MSDTSEPKHALEVIRDECRSHEKSERWAGRLRAVANTNSEPYLDSQSALTCREFGCTVPKDGFCHEGRRKTNENTMR